MSPPFQGLVKPLFINGIYKERTLSSIGATESLQE